MIARLLPDFFGKTMAVATVVLFAVASYLCVSNKAKQAHIIIAESKIAAVENLNRNLGEQLNRANQQIDSYLKQSLALQKQIAGQMQRKREKTDEILQSLEKNSAWADARVPDDVKRLLSNSALPSDKTAPAALPADSKLPRADHTDHPKP